MHSDLHGKVNDQPKVKKSQHGFFIHRTWMNTRDFKTFGIMLELHVGTRGAIFGVPCPEQPVVFGCVERPPVVDRRSLRGTEARLEEVLCRSSSLSGPRTNWVKASSVQQDLIGSGSETDQVSDFQWKHCRS